MDYHHLQCNDTMQYYVYNLTTYTGERNEVTLVATSVVMFLLAAIFFNLNLFSRFSDISSILNPSVRLFLSTSLSLFLPVMSYLFSEAKKEGYTTSTSSEMSSELSLRARTILMWMLLVELLRKKVDEILVNAGVQVSYSGTIERAARIGWLGYLIFFNLRSAGKKAFYGILWAVAAAKLIQRFVSSELARRSFAYGRNPQLLASYMAQMLQPAHAGSDVVDAPEERRPLLKHCHYVVMGEEELKKEASPHGYQLIELKKTLPDAVGVVTVGKIWELAERDELLRRDPKLKRLCLSFALYKLLRRNLEGFPITDAEARHCHDLIFRGLCEEEGTDRDENATAVALFKVFGDEVQLLCECYHSVHPVVLASPYFFLVNHILCPIVVWSFCALIIILCSNGDLRYALKSFKDDNFAVSFGVMKMTGCILRIVPSFPSALYATLDIAITALLILTIVYEEVWEFVVFLLSNWFTVSLLCSYTSCRRPFLARVIRGIQWVRSTLSRGSAVRVTHFSVLSLSGLPIPWCLPSKALPVEAKRAILRRLASITSDAAPPSNAWLKSHEYRELIHPDVLSFDSDGAAVQEAGVAEVILTWHIATELLVARHPLSKQENTPGAVVAMALSGYCAYLVAFHPELLPDDRDGTERVYKDTVAEMKKEMGCWGYYTSLQGARCDKLMEIAGRPQVAAPAEEAPATTSVDSVLREIEVEPVWTVLRKGARLGKALIERYAAAADGAARERVWQMVADVWTEVVVYAAPASGELQVKAHREALAQGGEFITVLWAIATHTGIARGAAPGTLSAPPPALSAV
ncbi:hypothetical protein ACP4OV_017124 [Aristida adscensionis]